jgi:hypothetical protein
VTHKNSDVPVPTHTPKLDAPQLDTYNVSADVTELNTSQPADMPDMHDPPDVHEPEDIPEPELDIPQLDNPD